MDLNPGTRLGHFHIVGTLGAGAMGEVYRAKDTHLSREVAIKVLPSTLAHDQELFQRFQREARIAASFSHPNVAAIHQLLQDGGTAFFAMELVEGESLREYLRRRKPGTREILELFAQIADGLEAAHNKGIVHRDLKPGNIKITPDGLVKVLDFGIAKVSDEVFSSSLGDAESEADTVAIKTEEGTIIGTPTYMSPEQARAEETDRRTDVWAFGCCLYEALTGLIAFEGDTTLDILTHVLERTPDWSKIPADVPNGVVKLLQRCLRKDQRFRLRDLGDAAIELREAFDVSDDAPVSGRGEGVWKRIALATTVLSVILAGALLVPREAEIVAVPAADARGMTAVHRTTIQLDPDMPVHSTQQPAQRVVDISPDGRMIVYTANVNGTRQLVLRRLDRTDSRPLIGTDDAFQPAFSPDGKWIAFISNGKLRKVSVQGGNLTTLCNAQFTFGLSWADNDTILFSSEFQKGVLRVSAKGGEPEEITVLAPRESVHGMPKQLPGRNAVLFSGGEVPELNQLRVMVRDLDTGDQIDLAHAASGPWYVPTGHVIFSQQDAITAIPFDVDTLSVTGDPVDITEAHSALADMFQARLGFSNEGTLVYAPVYQPGYAEREVVWVDRQGNETRAPLAHGRYITPRISPDGTQVAITVVDDNWEVWVFDLATGEGHQVTDDAGNDYAPAWSPDGERLVFASKRMGNFNLFETSVDGSGNVQRLWPNDLRQVPGSYSADGTQFAFNASNPNDGSSDVGLLTLGADPQYSTLIESDRIGHPILSPNGAWVAYTDQETSSAPIDVYIAPIAEPEQRHKVSVGGGREPVWGVDGRELFYRGADTIDAVAIDYEPELTIARPRPLFEDSYHNDGASRMYDISPDGERFLMLRLLPQDTIKVTELYLVENWFEDLRSRVPSN